MNEHDSENIAGMLEAMGFKYCDDPFEPSVDIVVMNTCSIRASADKRFLGVLGQFKARRKTNPDFTLCVCGCIPQMEEQFKEILSRFPWIDIVFGTQNISEFPFLLEQKLKTGNKQYSIVQDNPDMIQDSFNPVRLYPHKALVNIIYGCNNFCTYCVVPYTRGLEKSRPFDSIIKEIESLASDGVKEVMLLGQNVDSYNYQGKNFAELLRAVDGINGIERIRFMTSHPKDISDEMIESFANLSKLCHSIHLPVQSGSDRILHQMNRHYDRKTYLSIIDKLRAIDKNIGISTDIIVGFPGETEEDFSETLSLVEEVKFDSAFTFIYSPRPGTIAARSLEQIPEDIKHERFDRLCELQARCSLDKNKQELNQVLEVLVDGYSKTDNKLLTGRTSNNKIVNFASNDESILGKIINLRIIDTNSFALTGEMI